VVRPHAAEPPQAREGGQHAAAGDGRACSCWCVSCALDVAVVVIGCGGGALIFALVFENSGCGGHRSIGTALSAITTGRV
jgi:hypothetical protein